MTNLGVDFDLVPVRCCHKILISLRHLVHGWWNAETLELVSSAKTYSFVSNTFLYFEFLTAAC